MKKPALVLLIAGAVIGGFVAVAGTVGALVYFGARGFGVRPPTEDEKKLVVTASTLAGYRKTDPKCETLTFKRTLDGSREIEAEYDSTKCDTELLSFTANAEIARSMRDARESFALLIAAYKIGANLGGVTMQQAPALLAAGDQHYAAQLKQGENVVGNVFVVRQGRVVHGLFIVGLTFDDSEQIQELLAPLLEESARQFGGKRS